MTALEALSCATAALDWREPAVHYVINQIGRPKDRLVRITDVRRVSDNEAWVAVTVDDHEVVVGLRREQQAGDGWFRLLYLCGLPDSGA